MQQVRSDLGFKNEFIQIQVHLEVDLKFRQTSTSLFVIAGILANFKLEP